MLDKKTPIHDGIQTCFLGPGFGIGMSHSKLEPDDGARGRAWIDGENLFNQFRQGFRPAKHVDDIHRQEIGKGVQAWIHRLAADLCPKLEVNRT